VPDGGSGRAAPLDAVVVSSRRLWDLPWTAYCTELESVLAELLDADTVEIERRDGRIAAALAPRFRARNVAARWSSLRSFDWELPDRRYDLALVVVNDLRQLGVLAALPSWRSLARTFVAYVYEIWPAWVPAASPVIDQVVEHLDHLFVGIRVGAEAVQASTSTPVSFLLPAVDTLAIGPAVTVDDRRIDVSNRGRRDPRQHALLVDWARRTGAFYEFDTLRDGIVADPLEHRRHYYEQTTRSRAFVANPARFDLPELSAGAVEVGLRYLEALACGTVLVGDHPRGSSCRRVLGDPPGVAVLPAGAPTLGVELEQLLGDPATLHELGLANRAWALGHHDVVHRWEVMAAALGIGGTPGVDERRAALRIASQLVRPCAADQERLATAPSSTVR
jgi:hypothetical protein